MKPQYKGTWWLLATTFLLLFALSATDGGISLFGYRPKQSDMFSRLLGHREGSATIPEGSAKTETLAAAADSLPRRTQTDSLPKTILFFGDSMLEGLSPRLAAYCQASGHTLYTVIWYSSTSERWGTTDRLRDYIKRLSPDYIFICLGANELFVNNIIDKRTRYVKNILRDIGQIPYVWIGPPNWKQDTGVNRMILDNARPGTFFLSDGMHFERKKDGAHPTAASARLWMDSVIRWMPEHCTHPILMKAPTEPKARPRRIFIHQPNE